MTIGQFFSRANIWFGTSILIVTADDYYRCNDYNDLVKCSQYMGDSTTLSRYTDMTSLPIFSVGVIDDKLIIVADV